MPRFLLSLCFCLVLFPFSASAEETLLLRFPDLHGERVVFVYGGDLWTAPADGGTATRLTAHPGQERSPKFSPDGRWIAFNGQYDGDEQVYVIPAGGGEPRQLTFYPARGPLPARWGFDNQVYGWTSDGKEILFRSVRASWDLSNGRIYAVPVEGGLPRVLPMPESGGVAISSDGRRVVYSPLSRDFRTWKRYQGGWAQELYLFDLESHEVENISNHPRADRDPMWIGDTVYFSSDRDGTLNLYAYQVGSGEVNQVTHSDLWDVRWPSDDGEGRIVYQQNGALHVLDTATGDARRISVHVLDDGLNRRASRVSAAERIEGFGLSPKGERALVVAHGDVFTVPIEKGPTRNLTGTPGAHEKWAGWSPDGRWVAFLSDRDGEEELYRVSQDGKGEPEQLTDGGRAMRYRPEWSPDGTRIAFSDKDGKLYVLTLEGRSVLEVADSPRGQIGDYTWSPDGSYLAFSMGGANGFNSIYLWSIADSELHRVTDEFFNEASPVWGQEGRYLYYLSDREFAPQIGSIEWNYVVDRETGIFALALSNEARHPFPPESDEVTLEESEAEAAEPKKPAPIRIDFEGLSRRVARVPVEADNLASPAAVDGGLVFQRTAPFYYGRDGDRRSSLEKFSFEDRRASTLVEELDGFTVSADGKKILVRDGDKFVLYSVEGEDEDGGAEDAESLALDGLQVDRIPAQEWRQIFDEVWRRFRDFFYVENLHGYDWPALAERYRPLLDHVAHRSDLNYVIGEMIAELNVGHAYISGGEFEIPERPQVALPGALLELDADAGRYRIESIYPGHNEEERYRSPLTEIGVQASAGDYLLAIDGDELRAGDNPYRLLRHKADRPVELTLSASPDEQGARRVVIHPISDENDLRYLAWVEANHRRVEELSGGRIGYLHIPDMGAGGIREFIKWYYPQINKEGLVVDVRNNGGGNVSPMIAERLARRLQSLGYARTSDLPNTSPPWSFRGPMVCLLDEDSASDGDIFPYRFRKLGLGPLIGKRSWGGVVGITNRGTLMDGGQVFVPEFGFATPEGQWTIEGYGVDPDIEVENTPKDVIAGRDPQLERGVEEIQKQLPVEPREVFPPRPPGLDKTESSGGF